MRILTYRSQLFSALFMMTLIGGFQNSAASVIGTNPPAQPLTRERIAKLAPAERAAWTTYLDRSEKQRHADQSAFADELKRANVKAPTEPAHGYAGRSVPLDRDAAWYATAEASHIADVIVSFQTPAGGWGKNLDMSKEPRVPGERYGPNNLSNFLAPGDFDVPADPEWNYIGTIDNDATTTQLKFLAKVIAAGNRPNTDKYRAAFDRGFDYLLAAQFPNGGWPQVYPLEGGYHDAITYNDDAMTQVLDVLDHVANGEGEFAFASKEMRQRAGASFQRGIRCILDSQIKSNGILTGWAQQIDPLTLEPVSARNFEMPAISSGESAGILLLLMELPHPDTATQHSIRAAIAWLRKVEIKDAKWQSTPEGRDLVATAAAGPLWARYYQIRTDKPIFGDRDKSIHDDVKEISKERRNGYAWYGAGPEQALNRFSTWSQQHPESK